MGRRGSVTPAPTEQRSSFTVPQGYSTSKRASKAWIYALIPPSSFLIANETSCPFSENIRKLILVEVLWILQNTQQDVLKCWLANADIQVARGIVALLVMALGHFEYSVYPWYTWEFKFISIESMKVNYLVNTYLPIKNLMKDGTTLRSSILLNQW